MNRLPSWLRQDLPRQAILEERLALFSGLDLNTVCQEAHCPNLGSCFNNGQATFMILGDICSRGCGFCAVDKGSPRAINFAEADNLAKAAEKMNLNYVVITSVARDDLVDYGALQFVRCIERLHSVNDRIKIEVLIPDFQGSRENLERVVLSQPDVIGHNLETVARLYRRVRPQADYNLSLKILRWIKEINPSMLTKSGIMVGLGEDFEEVTRVMRDLRSVNCDILTIGQYLAPSKKHLPVSRFVIPEEFEEMKKTGMSWGFKVVTSAPLVRSSFMAEEIFEGLCSVKDGDL